eukprot:472367-Pleurochrysis_carterae.AAC.2
MVKSSAVVFKLPLVSRRESSWARYSVCSYTRRRRGCSSNSCESSGLESCVPIWSSCAWFNVAQTSLTCVLPGM